MRTAPAWAGLLAGPGAWAVATQLHYVLVPWACAHGIAWALVPALAASFAALAGAGAALSWQARRMAPAEDEENQTHRFLGGLGAALALLFAGLILLQGLGGAFFTGCES